MRLSGIAKVRLACTQLNGSNPAGILKFALQEANVLGRVTVPQP